MTLKKPTMEEQKDVPRKILETFISNSDNALKTILERQYDQFDGRHEPRHINYVQHD